MTTSTTDAEAIARKIMFVCESCADGYPEGCGHYDLNDLRTGPDGRWLCESCYDEPPRPETPWIDAEVPSVNAILSYLASRREAQEPVAWLRDLDGTGSLHPASQGDPEAFAVYRTALPAPTGEVERLRWALTALLRDDDEVDDCELCGGSGELTAMTTQSDRELVGCPTCISRERSRSARAALNGGRE